MTMIMPSSTSARSDSYLASADMAASSVNSLLMANKLNSLKDSRWLTLEVCRQYQRNACSRDASECKFAHPPAHVDIQYGRVTCCYDSIKGKCQRRDPPCKYLHPPQHLKEQLVQNGRKNLIFRGLQLHLLQQQLMTGGAGTTMTAAANSPGSQQLALLAQANAAAAASLFDLNQPTGPCTGFAAAPSLHQTATSSAGELFATDFVANPHGEMIASASVNAHHHHHHHHHQQILSINPLSYLNALGLTTGSNANSASDYGLPSQYSGSAATGGLIAVGPLQHAAYSSGSSSSSTSFQSLKRQATDSQTIIKDELVKPKPSSTSSGVAPPSFATHPMNDPQGLNYASMLAAKIASQTATNTGTGPGYTANLGMDLNVLTALNLISTDPLSLYRQSYPAAEWSSTPVNYR